MMIARRHWLITLAVILVAVAILFAPDRPPTCPRRDVKICEGTGDGPRNSQHIADWYTFSHITHGFVFYAIARLLLPGRPVGLWLIAATLAEMSWEVLENSPFIIDRYRQATIAVGYSGDSILNSVADGGWMILGFLFAARMPWKVTLAMALFFEAFTLWKIRDNLTLNVVMLIAPIDAVRDWQAGYSQPEG